MIGVITRADETSVVEEFFQLFKTPWEFYHPGRLYDVVIAAGDQVPAVEARLLLVYGSELSAWDRKAKLAGRSKDHGVAIDYQGSSLPLYGRALIFVGAKKDAVCFAGNSEIAGLRMQAPDSTVLRLGYDLFQEVRFLLSTGQPVEHAQVPALDIHIAMLREWILAAGISFVEIPPVPAGKDFTVCLTHDIDFIGIRQHKFDHTMWGFLYRSTVGALREMIKGRMSFSKLLKVWRAAASLPFVYLGWAKDFWIPFEWYLQVEKDLPATYYLIPFKRRAGDKVSANHAERRATAYDITDMPEWTAKLMEAGCEIGVHGIDAWHSVMKGREELRRVSSVTGEKQIGIRMHWLLRDENTFRVLEESGYSYDSTTGYNETPGYRSGTTQTFRPFGSRTLLELPMHIQDGALFYPQRLGLTDEAAWKLCERMMANSEKFGGVLTLLWHDRSHGPERFWGDFYARLVGHLRTLNVWFASGAQAVGWFRRRRAVTFAVSDAADGGVKLQARGERFDPPLTVRVHRPPAFGTAGEAEDVSWTGDSELCISTGRVLEEAPTSK